MLVRGKGFSDMLNYATTFSLLEWLAITGFAQGVLILVYIVFRARHWRQAFIPILYFVFLTAAFALQFAMRLQDLVPVLRLGIWICWAMGPPLCYLLVLQVVRMTELPHKLHFLVLLAVPLAAAMAGGMTRIDGTCDTRWIYCSGFFDALYLCGAMAGALCVLALWLRTDIFASLWRHKSGRERYWLVMMLLSTNTLALFINLLRAGDALAVREAEALLVTLGIAFIYLASTSLFRVYPPPVQLNNAGRSSLASLSAEEKQLAEKIRHLLEVDKVYQEHSFSRKELARETGVSESTVSKVVNAAFGCSLPKLLNEFRIEDAKTLLHEDHIPIQIVASESGFNSLASFNRVFRELTGETPSSYRAAHLADKRRI